MNMSTSGQLDRQILLFPDFSLGASLKRQDWQLRCQFLPCGDAAPQAPEFVGNYHDLDEDLRVNGPRLSEMGSKLDSGWLHHVTFIENSRLNICSAREYICIICSATEYRSMVVIG